MKSLPKASGIYIIETPNGSQYIGSSNNMWRRRHQHFTRMKCGRHGNRRLQAAWNKHGKNLTIRTLLYCAPKDLKFFEQRAMDVLKPTLNMAPEVAPRRQWTAEDRAKQAERSRGRKKTPEQRARLSQSLTGRTISTETRQKISQKHKGRLFGGAISKPWLGKKMSPAHVEKLAASHRGKVGPRLGQSLSAEARARISAKLKGHIRPIGARLKQIATYVRRKALAQISVGGLDYEVPT